MHDLRRVFRGPSRQPRAGRGIPSARPVWCEPLEGRLLFAADPAAAHASVAGSPDPTFGVNGRLVEVGSVDALAVALREYMGRGLGEEGRAALGTAA